MTQALPLGGLQSFGAVAFDPTLSSPPQSYDVTYQLALGYTSGLYPYNKRGYGASPQETKVDFVYLLKATAGLSAAASAADVEGKVGALIAGINGTWQMGANPTATPAIIGTTVSNHHATLTVQSAGGSGAFGCDASISEIKIDAQPGENIYAQRVTLSFQLHSPWQAL